MTTQLLKGELIHIQLFRMGLPDNKVFLRRLWKIRYFVQLVDTDIATKALPVAYNLFGKIDADARHLA